MSKNKCPRLLFNNSPHCLPLKAATTCRLNIYTHYMKPGIASAAIARLFYGQKQASKNKPSVLLLRVLLDSGSDGDLFFKKKRRKTHNVLCTIRDVP